MASVLKYPIRPLLNFTVLVFMTALLAMSCNKTSTRTSETKTTDKDVFPDELVSFSAYDKNPIFTGTGAETWDRNIRERGYILKEDDGYYMWYTGFRGDTKDPVMTLGYATSKDGIQWTRYANNPIFTENWVEDMIVVRHDSLYYMFAEGRNDIAHLLTSKDKISWTDHGSLDIRQTNGEPLSQGPYGTPTVYIEGDVWHLYYERNDEGIWLATSRDLKEWRHVQDEPVIAKGPEHYDKYGVALNQVIKYGDRYYGYYHGTPTEDWSEWNTNVVVSEDLVHWKKYEKNPILEDNKSSGILVHDGERHRLYTMHDIVQLHFSTTLPRNSGRK